MASEAASDPAPGSVRQYEARHSIVASRGSQADRRASHANSSIIHAHMLWRGEGGGYLVTIAGVRREIGKYQLILTIR